MYIYKIDTTKYASSGYYTTGLFYGNKPAIDKLWYSASINFKALVAGESLEILYSTDYGSNFTSIGTASYANDGGISEKVILFPAGTVSKHIEVRVTVTAGTSQATTPTLKDIVIRYRPIAEERYRWTLNLKCINNLELVDSQSEEPLRGQDLRNSLLVAKETKSTVDFEDVDFFETELNGALTATATTINLKSTANMPKKGRFKIDNEWITYTNRGAKRVTGCTRGARGTTKTTHTDGTTVSNLYKVLVRQYEEEVRVTNEAQAQEYYIKVQLEEV